MFLFILFESLPSIYEIPGCDSSNTYAITPGDLLTKTVSKDSPICFSGSALIKSDKPFLVTYRIFVERNSKFLLATNGTGTHLYLLTNLEPEEELTLDSCTEIISFDGKPFINNIELGMKQYKCLQGSYAFASKFSFKLTAFNSVTNTKIGVYTKPFSVNGPQYKSIIQCIAPLATCDVQAVPIGDAEKSDTSTTYSIFTTKNSFVFNQNVTDKNDK
ncbi:hypothetical protein TVAG_252230 [Trichomonas vaginalis G3]|uniref:Uncharacterized protein n=1 Tax=Trichomonas vaginalis (strain ATCC PRA-98 / G3) TaxID=412133 RepID=A2DVW5_TRIV3|nr:hypothetical protein TVAGG3_0846140 [Trichomonas vaginalis G3]EAY15410.1 hypothetical protein TVAG_252230 [Trichomonas vaginalis G3]KAI5499626.1 hypothetical protein TVAGG3_0846140 [Trichomonas vaginalis G3]|eukprot:XP_001327633.1 hypothetical protein [Trichomonas vaginalis G3]